MAAFIEAIGLISGVLGIIQFGIDNLPKEDSVGSTIRVTVGLDVKDGLQNAGGNLPDIRLFNEAGDFLGIEVDPGDVGSGEFGDITIKHNGDSGQQAAYTLFSANNDAICIAYAAITWPNGDKYGWIGDWGKQCGGSWYYSNVYISQSGVKPNCLWVDGDNNQPQTGFQVHWPEFANKGDSSIPESPEDKTTRLDYLCNAGPPFKMYNYPDTDPKSITFWTPQNGRSLAEREVSATKTSYGPSKHPVSARFQPRQNYPQTNQTTTSSLMGTRLVIGNSDQHTAEGLCESVTSFGPDFFDVLTGTFCRMSDKTIWPACDGATITDSCFNKDLNQLVINGVAARDEPYKKIIDWTA
ncbi:hypothetical protein HD806DRAFT_500324 [Xylariaceae sp. AK1471]|nr:hypothetical protein HD806DRAFT_500324 [Xylariaceae sp. AK1471]